MPEPTYRVRRLVWEQCEPGAFAICVASCVDAAKFAAEQWYLSRLLEALEPVEERT